MLLRPAERRFTACEKLLKAGAIGDAVNEALTIAVSDEPNDTSFLKIIIPNADVDYGGGHSLSLAVKHGLPNHITLLLEQRPNTTSFNNAFDAAMSHSEPTDQIKYCRMLLEASAPESSASWTLLKVVRAGRDDLVRLMLQHNASPNFEGGASLISAVHNKNVKILTSLVDNQKASKASLEAAFKVALGITEEQSRLELVQILLDAGVKGAPLHIALISQSKRGDQNIAIISMLLKYGASVDEQNGEALDNAAKTGASSLLQSMLHNRKVAYASLSRLVFPSTVGLLLSTR